MKWFRARKSDVNHDNLTRLGCHELEDIQHEVRHAAIAIMSGRRKALKAVRDLMDAINEIRFHVERIEKALNEGNNANTEK